MLIALLVGCAGAPKDTAPDDTAPVVIGLFTLASDTSVALPFVTAGDSVPDGTVTLTAGGDRAADNPVRIAVTGDFAVDGDTAPLGLGEARSYTVRYTGDTTNPVIATGTVTFTEDGQSATSPLAAVMGDPALPPATWIADAWGEETTVALPSAPFPYGSAPYTDSSVLLFYPSGLSDQGDLGVVAHLHGFNATISEIVVSQRLIEQTSLSGRDALLIVPQGPVDAEDGDFGRLDEPDGFAHLVRDAVSILYRDGVLTQPTVGAVALTSHSGGYNAAANIVEQGGVPLAAVHLFDSLYGRADTFQAYVEGGGLFRSVYTPSGGTDTDNEALSSTLQAEGVDVSSSFSDDALANRSVTIGPTDATHTGCLTDERSYARWLAASGLPHRPDAPPDLLSVLSDGATTVVTWRADSSGASLRYRVEGSVDDNVWTLLTDTDGSQATVATSPWIRVRTTDVVFGDSEPSDTYGGTGADWLIVDGFDRVFDGSWRQPTHSFAAIVGNSLGAPFSVVSNETVASGGVSLGAYTHVVWLLGDEGLSDRTFDDEEKAAIQAYLDGGGKLIVSGSEVGYATDPTWLQDVLHARYVADDAGTTVVEGWTVGASYTEDYPDVLDGDTVLWSWATGGAAAVGWNHQVIVVGFGVENLYDTDRGEALAQLEDWLG